MGLPVNTKNILNQLKIDIPQLGTLGSAIDLGGGFVNSVWTTGEAFANGTDEEKFQSAQNLLNKVLGMLSKLGTTDETNKAKEEDSRARRAGEKLDTDQKHAEEELKSNIDTIMGNADTTLANVTNELDNLQELGQDLSDYQKQAQKIVEEIEAKKQELETAKTKDDKLKVLKELQDLSGELAGVYELIASLEESINDAQEAAEEGEKEIAEAGEEAAAAQNEGTQAITEIVADGTGEINAAVKTTTDAAMNEAVAKTAEGLAAGSAVSAIFTFGGTAEKSAELAKIAVDNETAGGIRLSLAPFAINNATKVLGSLNGNVSALTSFASSIGGVTTEFNNVIGSMQSYCNPMIDAVGSYLEASESNDEFAEEAKEYEEYLNSLGEEEENDNSNLIAEFDTESLLGREFGV